MDDVSQDWESNAASAKRHCSLGRCDLLLDMAKPLGYSARIKTEIEIEDEDEHDLGEYHDNLSIPRTDPGWNAKRRREDR